MIVYAQCTDYHFFITFPTTFPNMSDDRHPLCHPAALGVIDSTPVCKYNHIVVSSSQGKILFSMISLIRPARTELAIHDLELCLHPSMFFILGEEILE